MAIRPTGFELMYVCLCIWFHYTGDIILPDRKEIRPKGFELMYVCLCIWYYYTGDIILAGLQGD